MRFAFGKTSTSPIGLDLGAHSVKLLQLRQEDGRWLVQAADSRVLADAGAPARAAAPEVVAGLIRQMLEGGAFTGKRVVSCLAAGALQYKNVRLPKMPPDELAQAVRWEASTRLRLSGDGFQLQYLDAGEVRQGDETRQEVIVMAAPAVHVDDHVALLTSCGLQPIAIDAAPGALSRLARMWQSDDADAAAQVVIDIGYAASKVLIQRQGQVVFFKLIEIGGQQFDRAVADAMRQSSSEAAQLRRGLASGEGEQALFGAERRETIERTVYEAIRGALNDLAREIGLCLRYYSVSFRGRRPEVAVLTGGESSAPNLVQVLSESAGIRAVPLREAAGESLSGVVEALAVRGGVQCWATTLGLALRGRQPAAMRGAA